MRKIVIIFFTILIFISCKNSKNNNKPILFAAASVTNVVNEIADEFHRKTGVPVKLNIASSGILARQIENGAEFDYYISANKDWMNYLDSLQLVNRNLIINLASNQLVAIVPASDNRLFDKNEFLEKFPQLFKGRLSIGDPNHVPAGKYALQVLKYYNWTEQLINRYLPAKNVREALLMVEMGEAEMGIVYATDALKSKKVRTIYEFQAEASDKISYLGAAKKIKSKELDKFIEYLQSKDARNIWINNGFKID